MSTPLAFEDKFFTVEAAQTPTKMFKVKIRVPKLEDRLQAQSIFPGPDSQVGYTESEYLLASCIHEINDRDLRQLPMDVIDRVEGLPYQDLQYLMALFTRFTSFSATDEVDKVKKIADKLYVDPSLEIFTVSKENLPTGTVSITFQTPRMKDRIKAQRQYPGRREAGYPFEDFMFAYSVTHINGQEVFGMAPMDRLRSIFLIDYTHASEIFYRLSVLNDQSFKTAESEGKDIFQGLFSSSNGSSPISGTVTTGVKSARATATPPSSTANLVPPKSTGTEPKASTPTSTSTSSPGTDS